MKKNIIDSIENLKHHTHTSISNIQIANIPSLYNLNLERRYKFSVHGFVHTLFNENSLVYVSNNIPFTHNQKRHTFCDTLDKLVGSGEVYPFLLFLNHEFVKWSNIVILKDCKYAYVIILDYPYETDVNTKECIVIPQYITYRENNSVITDNTIFAFNSTDNKLVEDLVLGSTYTTIDLLNFDEIYFEEDLIKYPESIQHFKLEANKKVCDENLIVFSNGYLANSFLITEILPLNLFKIGDKTRVGNNSIKYKLFYYNKSNESKDNIQGIVNKHDIAIGCVINNKIPEYITRLNEKFDFNYNKNISYEENVYNSLNYIMKYNSGLLNTVYKDKSNISSRVYTGIEINSKMDNKGYVTMSRRIGTDTSTQVIILKNGELYKGYSELRYKNKNFIFPIIDIKDDDVIEILSFKNIDNRRIKLSFDSLGDDIYLMDSSVDMDNMKLFTMNVETHEFNIERKDSVQYEIDYSYERMSNNTIKIIPNNSFYYDRTLSLASRRQFRYASKIAKECCIDIELPDEFRFCNEKEKYLVFVNGRKIDNQNFKVTIFKPTRPFDDISTYVNIPLEKGDKLEVIYVPDRLEEVVVYPNIDLTGNIVIDKSKIAYNFDKDLYLLFINGKKIRTDQMIDIDQTRVKIISDIKSIRNLCVIKHIGDEEILSSLFNENKDKITEIIDSLTNEELNKLYGDKVIEDIEDDFKENEISMKSVMYKLIHDYYLRPYINTGEEFIYDFDDEFLEKDDEGNIIIRALDASLEDKIGDCE